MQTADVFVPAFADDAVILDNDGTHHRIGGDMPHAALGKLQRTAHIIQISCCHICHIVSAPKRQMYCGSNAAKKQ